MKGVSLFQQLKSSFQRSMRRLFSNLKFSKINKSEHFSSGSHDFFFNCQRVILIVWLIFKVSVAFKALLNRFYRVNSVGLLPVRIVPGHP